MSKALFYSIDGEKVKFKKMTIEDNEAIHSFASDPEVSRFIGWPLMPTLEDTTNYINELIKREALGSHIYSNVIDKSTNAIVGTTMLFNFNNGAKHAEIGYVFHQNAWGNGLCTETVKLTCDFAFNVLDLHKIHAQVTAANIGSSRVLEKNGFQLEGRQIDYYFIEGQYHDNLLYGKL